MAHLIKMHTAEEIAAEDPFGGRGVFLPMDAGADEILAALEEAFGPVPAVTWPRLGAWVDTAGESVPADAEARWGSREQAMQ